MRIVGEVFQTHAPRKYLAHLAAIDVQRRNHDVRGLVIAQLKNDFGQIGLEDADARGFQKGIQLNLGRSHGLDLDHFAGVLLPQQVEDRLPCLSSVGGPVNRASGSRAAGFKFFEVGAEVFKGLRADGRCRRTQFLPVGFFCYQFGALCLDYVNGVGHVMTQLRVAQDGQCGLREWWRGQWVQVRVRHGRLGCG